MSAAWQRDISPHKNLVMSPSNYCISAKCFSGVGRHLAMSASTSFFQIFQAFISSNFSHNDLQIIKPQNLVSEDIRILRTLSAAWQWHWPACFDCGSRLWEAQVRPVRRSIKYRKQLLVALAADQQPGSAWKWNQLLYVACHQREAWRDRKCPRERLHWAWSSETQTWRSPNHEFLNKIQTLIWKENFGPLNSILVLFLLISGKTVLTVLFIHPWTEKILLQWASKLLLWFCTI